MKISKQSVELLDKMGSDLSVVNAARVSFNKGSTWEPTAEWSEDEDDVKIVLRQILSEKDQKLINYLAKHNHWSPFAHTSLQFRIKAPLFVAAQLKKHQVGGVWNEVSRRYVDDEPEFYLPKHEWRLRAEDKKQGSQDEFIDPDTSVYVQTDVEAITKMSLDTYNFLLSQKVAPEQARMILPQNTMTEWIWSGSLAFFARVCKQRLDSHAQAETREIAQMINDQIPSEFEYSWKALMQ